MSSAQGGEYSGPQGAQSGNHPFAHQPPTDSTSPGSQTPHEGTIEIDESYLSPEVRALLEQSSGTTGLEVDEDENGGEGYDGYEEADEDEEPRPAQSVYAMSMYPSVGPAYQVEHPYENGQDSATMCVPHFPAQLSSGIKKRKKKILTLHQRFGANVICRGL